MTALRRKVAALWIFTAASCMAAALHHVLIGYALLLVVMLIRLSLPRLALSKRMQWLMLGAVVLANIAFWTRDIPVVPVMLWTVCGLVAAWLIVLGIRWDVRLFHE
jgi:hypothetical protein